MPQLCLDLDIMERNARRVANEIESLGKLWRPHVKSHGQPEIARLLLEIGACGVTAATVDEVETMAAAGIPSVLLAHIAVESTQLSRLAKSAKQTDLIVCCDHFVQAENYSHAAAEYNVQFGLLIDINVGMQRTGCRPGVDAFRLASAADQLPGVKLRGIMGYEGHLLTIEDATQKRQRIFEAMGMLRHTRDLFEESGLNCEIVSAGASGSFWITGEHPTVTELQAGGAIFGDLFYSEACGLTDIEPALFVDAHVISRPSLERAVINAGRKAINPVVCMPRVANIAGATIDEMSAEHTTLCLQNAALDLTIGSSVRIHVGYSDHTILMHRKMHLIRNNVLVGELTIPAA